MLVVVAIDALEHALVERFGCDNLKQESYGKTDISEFSQPRTMVLWSSFLTGENKESEVLADGNEEMWSKTWKVDETFLKNFSNPIVIDLPGFSYDIKQHDEERRLLKKFFETEDLEEKVGIRKKYNQHSFNHHREIKKRFEDALDGSHDIVICYFSVADVIGHLNFGNTTMIRMIYRDLDDIVGSLRKGGKKNILVLSDHGMTGIGMFGDHSDHGFWSTNWDSNLEKPKITDFFSLLKDIES